MPLLCRLLVVCLFALFAVRGASACESMPHRAGQASAHVMPMTHATTANPTHHDSHCGNCHASCCMAGCGHCGAPPATFGFNAQTPNRATSRGAEVALRAGITHAPPLPPPIA